MLACFHSLQTGKCIQRRQTRLPVRPAASFHSLQTGKCIQSGTGRRCYRNVDHLSFPFPSNGKVYSKTENGCIQVRCRTCFNSLQTGKCIQRNRQCGNGCGSQRVSIPFKRESVFKARKGLVDMAAKLVSIPFKRESVFKEGADVIPLVRCCSCFNSLQTGKCIQRQA